MLDKRQFYINGSWVAPSVAKDIEVIDPSTEEVCAVISCALEEDTNTAIAVARQAFESWRSTSREERLDFLERLLAVYKRRVGDMAAAISLEMGAPIDFSKAEQAQTGITHLEDMIKVLSNFVFERPLRDDTPRDYVIYEPIGVVGLITPWNWPISQVALKVVPALAAGCSCVLKPSEIAPLSSMLFAEMIDEVGFPKGVFNLVNGSGVETGRMISSHPDIDMVSFTGSTRAGRDISKNAADTIKRVCLELGGKGANVIFADADADAVKRGAFQCFDNTGQSCNAPSRMLVERSIYDKACKDATAAANEASVGLASAHGEHLGPVVSEVQYNKIQALIQKGIDEGAKLLAGGTGRAEGFNSGYFVKPTVFADVSPSMTIAIEEIFGPVLSVIPFDTEEEAIEIANDTLYGLTNYVQTADWKKAERFARKFRSGMVAVNGIGRSAGTPFGGFKQSGNGRESGPWGLEEYLEVKAVSGWKS